MRLRPEAECLGGELRPWKRSHSESVSEPRLLVSGRGSPRQVHLTERRLLFVVVRALCIHTVRALLFESANT